MKRTRIKYKVLGDEVEIVRWEHIASLDEISDKCGVKLGDIYHAGNPCYYLYDNGGVDRIRIWFHDGNATFIDKGEKFLRKEFTRIIDAMKQAGDRLSKLIKEDRAAKAEVREVLI